MALSVSDLTPQPTEPVQSRWRRIVTPIPAPDSVAAIEALRAVEPKSMAGMPPVLWDQAEGFLVRDAYGNQWIDVSSGIMAANAGHGHPRIRRAIQQAVDRKLLLTYAFASEIRRKLLRKLCSLAPFEDAKAIVFSAGTEATECAMMLMRRHGQRLQRAKTGIVSFAAGYHGRTLAAALASGTRGSTDWLPRGRAGHYQIPFPFCPRCPWGRDAYDRCGRRCFENGLMMLRLWGVGPDRIAGFIGESMPGWATWPLPDDFAAALTEWAAEHRILVTFDEVQSGCGRTGRFCGFEHSGGMPDLITMGKGLTSSLPVSAVIGRRELMDQPQPGDMSSTHGGNPICAATALACLEVIEDEKLVEASAGTGALALARLGELAEAFPDRVLSVHGRGLFISVHLTRPDDGRPDVELANAVPLQAVRRGVMMFTTGREFFKFAPPLGIDPDAALEAADVIRDCMADLVQSRPRTGSGRTGDNACPS